MKKSWVKSVLLVGVMTTAAACAPVGGTAYHKIDAEAVKTMLDQETGIAKTLGSCTMNSKCSPFG